MGPTTRITLSILIFVVGTPSLAEDWTQTPPRLNGTHVLVSCHGLGPDKDLAFRNALDQCRGLAVDQLASGFDIESLTIETETSAAYHEEISASRHISGLQCLVRQQREQDTDSGISLWLQCDFDSAKTKIESSPGRGLTAIPSPRLAIALDSPKPEFIQSQNKQLIIATVPQCESMLVRGKMNRVIDCESNPISLLVYSTDKEIIIRAKGYDPEHITLSGDRNVIGETEALNVYLKKQ